MRWSSSPLSPTDPTLPVVPGAEVEVWCPSLGSWSHGFVAMDVDADGWRILRRSDRSQLPVRFPDADLRPTSVTHRSS
jgi:hypothetical protein